MPKITTSIEPIPAPGPQRRMFGALMKQLMTWYHGTKSLVKHSRRSSSFCVIMLGEAPIRLRKIERVPTVSGGRDWVRFRI